MHQQPTRTIHHTHPDTRTELAFRNHRAVDKRGVTCEFGDGIKAALNHGHGGVACRRRDTLLRPRPHPVGLVPNDGPGGGRAGLGFVDAAGPVLDGKEFDVSAAVHGDVRAQGVELTVIAGHRDVVTIVVWH